MEHEIERPSPSGRFKVVADCWEPRMSQWVYTFQVIEIEDKTVLFECKDPCWSLDVAEWLSDDLVRLTLRKYPGGRRPDGIVVLLDCVRLIAVLNEKEVPFSELEAALEAALDEPPLS